MQTILLVEDEAIIALVEAKTLEGFGYRVKAVRNGEEAVVAACDESVDLVLMDIDLGPGIDGTEAARRILDKRNLPIVFLTSHSERECVERVRGITRYGYVIKNSGNFVLQSSIEMAFELFSAHERLSTGEARLSTLLATIPDLVWLKDMDGAYLACNPTFSRFIGAAREEVVGKTDYEFFDRELADFFRAKDKEAIELGRPNSNEEWITFADDGHRALLETIKTPMRDASGRLVGILGIGRDITERKRIEDALAASEASVRRKLEAIMEPGADLGELRLADIMDIPMLQALMEDFSALTGMVTAFLDTEGNVLVATGWRDICTKFHRANPASAAACTESDLFLSEHVKEGEYVEYRCGHDLWDIITPLYIEGRHLGNIFSGQFFYKEDIVDESFFSAQAERYGFDRDEYLAALAKVPRYGRAEIGLLMDYLVRLTKFVSKLSYSNLLLARSTTERQRAEERLSKSVAEKEVLLKELQHRVKNSLAVVSSLLRLSMADLGDERDLRVFQEAADRVRCVGMVYEKLSESASEGKVDLGAYLADLTELLRETYVSSTEHLRISAAFDHVDCSLKRAVSVGLVLNELFTNAVKYAYGPGEAGELRMTLRASPAGGELCVADDGPGLPAGLGVDNAKSLGLRIVGLLAVDLGGSVEFSPGPGTRVILRF